MLHSSISNPICSDSFSDRLFQSQYGNGMGPSDVFSCEFSTLGVSLLLYFGTPFMILVFVTLSQYLLPVKMLNNFHECFSYEPYEDVPPNINLDPQMGIHYYYILLPHISPWLRIYLWLHLIPSVRSFKHVDCNFQHQILILIHAACHTHLQNYIFISHHPFRGFRWYIFLISQFIMHSSSCSFPRASHLLGLSFSGCSFLPYG